MSRLNPLAKGHCTKTALWDDWTEQERKDLILLQHDTALLQICQLCCGHRFDSLNKKQITKATGVFDYTNSNLDFSKSNHISTKRFFLSITFSFHRGMLQLTASRHNFVILTVHSLQVVHILRIDNSNCEGATYTHWSWADCRFQGVPQFQKSFRTTNIFCHNVPTAWAACQKVKEYLMLYAAQKKHRYFRF